MPNQTERKLILHMASDIDAEPASQSTAYIKVVGEPLTLPDAVRVVGPRAEVTELKLYQPPSRMCNSKMASCPRDVPQRHDTRAAPAVQ